MSRKQSRLLEAVSFLGGGEFALALTVQVLSLVARAARLSGCGARASPVLECGSVALCAGFSSCAVWAWLPCSMWDLSSLTRDQTQVPCAGRCLLQH